MIYIGNCRLACDRCGGPVQYYKGLTQEHLCRRCWKQEVDDEEMAIPSRLVPVSSDKHREKSHYTENGRRTDLET